MEHGRDIGARLHSLHELADDRGDGRCGWYRPTAST